MTCINFKKKFVNQIVTGKKTSTIRKRAKQPINVGHLLHFKTGLRTKFCRAVGQAYCISSDEIIINGVSDILINGEPADTVAIMKIYRADGFFTVGGFVDFFEQLYGLPFTGAVISWGEVEKENAKQRDLI